MDGAPKLYVIVPCYNEESALPKTAPQFLIKLNDLSKKGLISDESRIMFVNDGSSDRTWEIIKELAENDSRFVGISQSRNRGHQNAVLAGLMESKDLCDITISIDCDGQDDLNAMEEMVVRYCEGYEVVYGVRRERKTDSLFKRFTAQSFYRLLICMGVEIRFNHADYRLISSRVLQELSHFKEVNLFLRGLIPLVGFPSTEVYYDRLERVAGQTHYSLSKMLGLAMDGITSLSIRPIRMITILGTVFASASFVGIIWALIQVIREQVVKGWASMICILCFIGGIQMIALGIIGEYIGKIYLETKERPRYIISDRT